MSLTIRTSYIPLALIVAGLFLSAEPMAQNAKVSAVVNNEAAQLKEERATQTMRVEAEKRGSSIALQRARTSCIIVWPVVNGAVRSQAGALGENTTVVDAPVDGVPLAEGAYACTEAGYTAEIRNGKATNVYRIRDVDKDEYLFALGFIDQIPEDKNPWQEK